MSRIAAWNASCPAFTVPRISWFFRTMFRMRPSVSTGRRTLVPRNAGHHEDAVGAQDPKQVEGHPRVPRRFVGEVDVPHALAELVDGVGLGRDERGPERGHEACLPVVFGLRGVDEGLEPRHREGHGPEEPHRARAQDHGVVAMAATALRGVGTVPGKAMLQLPELDEGLLGDGERLDQHRDRAKLLRHHVHVPGVVHDELGHEAVGFLDSPLADVAGEAEVLSPRAAGAAVLVVAGTPHHGHDQVPQPHATGSRAHLHDLRPGIRGRSPGDRSPPGGVPYSKEQISRSVPQTPTSRIRSFTSVGRTERGHRLIHHAAPPASPEPRPRPASCRSCALPSSALREATTRECGPLFLGDSSERAGIAGSSRAFRGMDPAGLRADAPRGLLVPAAVWPARRSRSRNRGSDRRPSNSGSTFKKTSQPDRSLNASSSALIAALSVTQANLDHGPVERRDVAPLRPVRERRQHLAPFRRLAIDRPGIAEPSENPSTARSPRSPSASR